jgi:hypothetical protein
MKIKILLTGVLSVLLFNGLFAQSYCSASGGICWESANYWITGVEIDANNFSNFSECASGLDSNDVGYSDFTNMTVAMAPDGIYSITVSSSNSYWPGDVCDVYIDWNNDKIFDEVEEKNTLAGSGFIVPSFTGVISVPANAVTDIPFRMRIRWFDIDGSPGIGACGPTTLGEVEDYTIIVSETAPVPGDYCEASGPACNTGANSWITNVAVNTANPFSNASDCADGSGTSLGYSDFSSLTMNMDLGATYTITVTPGAPFPGDNCEMFADWNGDKVFDEENERIVVTGGVPGALSGPYTGDATVPVDAFTNEPIRLRVRTYDASSETEVLGACGNSAFGEVEDYSIQVVNPNLPQCAEALVPADLATTVCTNTTLSWTSPSAGATPTGYKIYLGTDYPPTNVHNGLDVALDTFKVMQGLMPATTYFWRVLAYNADGSAQFCDTLEFTTSANANPSVSILADGIALDSVAVCSETDLPLLASITGGAGSDTFVWTGNTERIDDDAVQDPTYNSVLTNKTDTLFVSIEDAEGCTATDSIKVFAKPLPDSGTAEADQTVCNGAFVDVSINGSTGDIQWQDSTFTGAVWNNIINGTQAVENFGPITDTTYYRAALDLDGCTGVSNLVKISLHDATAKPDVVASQNPFCEGDTITLTTDNINDNLWSTGETTQDISVHTAGDYFVVFTDENNCSAISDTITIVVNPKPQAPFIEQLGDSLVSDVQVGVQWYNDSDGLIVGANEVSYTPTDKTTQNYYATYTDGNGCESDPSNVVLYVSTIGISENQFSIISLSPNPANNSVVVHGVASNELSAFSITGEQLNIPVLNSSVNDVVFDVSQLSNGVYILVVNKAGAIKNYRLLIQH